MRHALCLIAVLALAVACAQEPPNLITNGDFADGLQGWYVTQSDICKAAVVPAEIGGFHQALRADLTPKDGTNAWDASATQKLTTPLTKGDVARIQIWLRSPQSCRVNVIVQLSHDPWSTVVGRAWTALPQWREFTVQGRLAEDHPAGDVQLSLQLAANAGQIDLAGVRVANLGPNAPDRFLAPANPLNLIPFVLPWDDSSPSVTNVSAWLDKPAGARGFITVKDGHLFSGDKRVRFVGTNICTSAAFPDHATAEKVAARLAKFGINCVRFHHMDASWGGDLILQPDKRTLDPTRMERLDYLIAQLKANGIYTNLNLHVSRVYPDMPTWPGMPDFFKGTDIFYPPMLEMQRDYARQLLTHLNPYTKTRYVDEPAVAIVEINNENGLLSQWGWGSLDGMAQPYADELQKQWNTWLKAKYADPAAMTRAWNVVTKPLGEEMLGNGDFARGMDEQWFLEVNGTAKATGTVANNGPGGKPAATISVTETDDQGWHVQLVYPGLKFEAGGLYTMEFDARADIARSITADARQHHDPWRGFWQQEVKLTPEWKHFRFGLTIAEGEDRGRITFSNLGAMPGKVQLSGVSFRPGGGTARPSGEPGNISLITKADFSAYSQPIQDDWLRFLWDTETAYWTGMAKSVQDLGVKCPVVGTAAGFSPIGIQSQLEVVDTHAYWQHPHFPGRPWDGDNWVLPNIPMAGRADGGTLPGLALCRVAGKPFLVTEYNHPAPNIHNAEGFLLMAAYAGLQDWDGFFSFAYEGGKDSYSSQRINGYFDVEHHPTQMATMPTAAALFLRGDMASPTGGAQVAATPEQLYEIARKGGQWGSWANAGALGLSKTTALQRPVSIAIGGKSGLPDSPPAGDRLTSDGGQWVWDSTKGQERVLINTVRTKGLIGWTGGGPVSLGDVNITPGKNLQDWAAITLTAMDGGDFAAPGRVLITATGYAENTSMGWKNEQKNTVGSDWGIAPTLVEGIPATITLPVAAERVTAWALDEKGQRGAKLPVTDAGGKATLSLGPASKTLWYEVEIK